MTARAAGPALLVLSCLAGLPACKTPENLAFPTLDPVVVVHGEGGDELAVSTNYGVVFLGRGVTSGRVYFTTWFGDGPSTEEGLVEDVGGGVYVTEAEILLPCVEVCFDELAPGTAVVVRGRRNGVPWEIDAELTGDPRVEGILLRPNPKLDDLGDDALGAGVFLMRPQGPVQLVGLLSGRVKFPDGRRYLTSVGPESLWRLVVNRRNSDRPRRWVYREDIL